MEILEKLTKEVFEQHVPAARRPKDQTSVYDRLKEHFTTAYDELLRTLITPERESLVEETPELLRLCLKAVSLRAFQVGLRSLDLVLTATGFGVVSTESTAPASKARVDALDAEVTVTLLRTTEIIIDYMRRQPEWGCTPQAERHIPTLFWRPSQLGAAGLLLTPDNWAKVRGRCIGGDGILRSAVSEEYMDELIRKERTDSLTSADQTVVLRCNAFTADYLANYDLSHGSFNRMMLDRITELLENSPAMYPTYNTSNLYHRRHADRYQNRQEDSTFFFM